MVASDAGGLREVVLHDQTGTLCYANNPESLAWAICRALESGDEARSMAQSAKERLRTDFDWSRLAEQTRSVYDRTWNEFLSSFWVADTLWPLSPARRNEPPDFECASLPKQARPFTGPQFLARPLRKRKGSPSGNMRPILKGRKRIGTQ